MTIPELLSYASNCGASDLFITANKAPSFRVSGELTGSEEEINTASEIDSFRRNHITPEAEDIYRKTGSVDAALSLETGERFRVNYLQTSFGPGMVARPIHSGNELYIESLGLPVVLGEICAEKDGLIIVSGTSRCGKSTTLGALVN